MRVCVCVCVCVCPSTSYLLPSSLYSSMDRSRVIELIAGYLRDEGLTLALLALMDDSKLDFEDDVPVSATPVCMCDSKAIHLY